MAETDLRPMTLGELLDRTFTLYRNNFLLFAGIIALPLLAYMGVSIGFTVWTSGMTTTRGNPALNPAYIGGVFLGLFVGFAIYMVMIEMAHAATVFAVSDLYLGRTPTVRQSFARLKGRILRLLGVAILCGLIVGAGFIALFIPGIILACRLAVAVPVTMLEDEYPAAAISRSMELTKGFAMQVFLIGLLIWVISFGVSMLFQSPFFFLIAMQKNGLLPLGMQILQHLCTFLAAVLVGPIGTIAFALMYYNLRVRKEAFDLQHLMTSLGPSSGPVVAPGASPVA
ncbi:MAG TPA: hypothetical protein VMH00_03830 [Candidatus Limnocylindrales bacterium]|nr:hypothetical protein [Candidatus Limnocylindrales bacterium]